MAMISRLSRAVPAIFLGIFLFSAPVFAGLVAVGEDGQMYAVDSTTGAATLLGPAYLQGRGITYDVNNDVFYVSTSLGEIGRIDRTTGIIAGLGPIGFNGTQSLAYDAANDILYSARGNASDLLNIDMTTGAGTAVASISLDFGSVHTYGLAFDASTDTLYGTNGNRIYSIDPVTGLAADPFGIFGFQSESIEIDPLSGRFFGINTGSQQLIVFDPVTGIVSSVGLTGGPVMRGLTYVPAATTGIPAPAAVAIFAFGLAGIVSRRRLAQ